MSAAKSFPTYCHLPISIHPHVYVAEEIVGEVESR